MRAPGFYSKLLHSLVYYGEMKLTRVDTEKKWQTLTEGRALHPLQSWRWGQLKASQGWTQIGVQGGSVPVMILLRPLPWPFRSIAYIPRSTLAEQEYQAVLEWLKAQYAVSVVKIEPLRETFELGGASSAILPAETICLDLTKSEEELQAAMAKKTRQYIRKSSADTAFLIRSATEDDLTEIYQVYQETAQRARFLLHGLPYYQMVWRTLDTENTVLVAEQKGKIIAFLWVSHTPYMAYELYGGVTTEGQQLRCNYALKWRMIQEMKKQGIVEYDFGGLIGEGVSTFKKGWASSERRYAGSFEVGTGWRFMVWRVLFRPVRRVLQALRKMRQFGPS